MSTTYMNITLPTVSVTTGPLWAQELNDALTTVDSHDHTSGKGTLIPVSGLNVNSNLSINSFELQTVDTVKMVDHVAVKTGLTDVRNVYPVNGDLYYNNNSGAAIQITSGSSISSAGSVLVPAGVILPYGGTSAPTGYLPCDGAAVSRTTYSALFGVVGTVYGVGNGTTTFNVPNLLGRAPIGAGTYTDTVSGSITRTLGASLGAEAHVVTTAQMPSHTHIQNPTTHNHNNIPTILIGNGGAGALTAVETRSDFSSTLNATGLTVLNLDAVNITATNQNTGGGLSHNNMQPSLVINYIIKSS